jgi:hypothetical protein
MRVKNKHSSIMVQYKNKWYLYGDRRIASICSSDIGISVGSSGSSFIQQCSKPTRIIRKRKLGIISSCCCWNCNYCILSHFIKINSAKFMALRQMIENSSATSLNELYDNIDVNTLFSKLFIHDFSYTFYGLKRDWSILPSLHFLTLCQVCVGLTPARRHPSFLLCVAGGPAWEFAGYLAASIIYIWCILTLNVIKVYLMDIFLYLAMARKGKSCLFWLYVIFCVKLNHVCVWI